MRKGKIIKRTLAALAALCLTVTALPAALFASADPTGDWAGDLTVTDTSSKAYVESPYATADHWTGPESWSDVQLTPIEDANEEDPIDASQILTVPVTFVDYGATPEAGRTNRMTDITEWNKDFVAFNQAIQKYHIDSVGTETILSKAKFKFPLYFGTFGQISNLTNLLGTVYTENNAYAARPEVSAAYRFLSQNPGFMKADDDHQAPGSTAILGMVGNTLDAEGRLMSRDGAVMPYFDYGENGFLTQNPEIATVYRDADLSFPFVRDETQLNRYVFDSSTGRHNVRVTKDETGDATLTFDSGKNIENWTQNEITDKYGFFPFNDSFDESLNFGFGMRLDIPFTLDDAENSYFYFSGDDDVWVYVDGVLMLDLGGVRARTGGYINFGDAITVQDNVKGTITLPAQSSFYTGTTFWPKGEDGNALASTTENYRQLDMFYHDAATLFDDLWTSSLNEDTAALYNKSAFQSGFAPSIATLLQNAGYTGDALVQKTQALYPNANDTTQHTLTVFYMERGLYDSNLHIEFTFNPVDLTLKSGLTIQNQVDYKDVNEGLRAVVDRLVDDNLQLKYVLARADGTNVNEGEFTLAPDKSKNFNRTDTAEGDTPRGKQYTLSQTVGGMSSGCFDSCYSIHPVENGDAVENAPYTDGAPVSDGKQAGTFTYPNGTGAEDETVSQDVTFVNRVRATDVTLTKALADGATDPGAAFGFKVNFSRLLGLACDVPFTGTYTVEGDTATYTATDGMIYVPAGKTATLGGIPVGSKFTVTEEDKKGLVLAGVAVDGASYVATDTGATVTMGEETASVAITVTNRDAAAEEYYGQVGRWVWLPMEELDTATTQSVASLAFEREGTGIATATGNGFSSLTDHTNGVAANVYTVEAVADTYGYKMTTQNVGFRAVLDSAAVSALQNASVVRVTVGYYVPTGAARDNSRFGVLFSNANNYVIHYGADSRFAASGLETDKAATVSFELSAKDAQAFLSDASDKGVSVVYWNYNDNAEADDYMYLTSFSVEAVSKEAATAGSSEKGDWKPAADTDAAALNCPVGGLLYKAKATGDDRFTVSLSDGSVKSVIVHNYQTRDQLYVLDYGLPVGLTSGARGEDAANYTGSGTDATVTLVYATANQNVTATVTVGGTEQEITLPPNGNWGESWVTKTFRADLTGDTTIRFAHKTDGFNIREILVTTQAGTTTYSAANSTYGTTVSGEPGSGWNEALGCVGNMHNEYAYCEFRVSNPNGERLASGADTLNFFGAMGGTPASGEYAGGYTKTWKDRYSSAWSGAYGELTIDGDDLTASKYTPKEFMNGADAFVYGVQVTAAGETASNAADATPIMQGSIKFVPAGNVYYEDDFGVGATAITYIGDVSANKDANTPISSNGSYRQDNDNDTLYGYDDVYFDQQAGSAANVNAHVMRASSVATFNFKGTGFDLYGTTENRDVTVRVFVYNAATVTIDPATGKVTARAGQTAKLEAVTLVNTMFKNGVNVSGSEALTNVPVVALRNLPQDTEHLVKIMISPNTTTPDLRFYFEGVRVYDPLDDASAYAPTEQGVTYERLHAMILGSGKVTCAFDGEKATYTYEGTGEGAKASLFAVGDGSGMAFSAGETVTEDYAGDTSSPLVTTSDLLSYMMQGPNNEVYLSGGNGVAFMATATDDANPTMQISVKRCKDAQDEAQLVYLTKDGAWAPLAAARDNGFTYSKTEMYYAIPVENCYQLNGQHLIALRAGASAADTTLFSLINLKYKGYTFAPIQGSALEALTVSASSGEAVDGETRWKVLSDGRVLVTFATGTDIADVRITLNGDDRVIADQIVCGSTKDGAKQWRVILPAKADGTAYEQSACTIRQAVRGSASLNGSN